jgi:nucleoside-diphosphate-sugar epimerase
MQKILLIGGQGYLGKYITKNLNKKFFFINPKKKLNILKVKNLQNFFDKDLNCVINLTGQIGKNVKKINNTGNKNIIKIIKKKKIKPLIIFFSTTLAKSFKKELKKKSLINNYVLSKINAENFLKNNYDNYIILRLSNVYDDNFKKNGILKNIIISFKKKLTLKITNPNTFRNYIHVKDVINHLDMMLKFSDFKKNKKIITLINENFSIKNIIKFFEIKYKKKIKTINLNVNLKNNFSQKFDVTKYKNILKFNKYKLEDTIKKFNDNK